MVKEKIDNKKSAVLKAALTIFSKEGYHNAKVSDIADMAGIATGSVYLYFRNKEHILEEIFVTAWTKLEVELLALTKNKSIDAGAKIECLVNVIIEMVDDSKEIANMILHEYFFWGSGKNKRVNLAFENSKESLINILKEGAQSGIFRKDLISDIDSNYFIGGLWYLMSYWTDNYDKFDKEKVKQEAINLLLVGLK